MTDGALPVEGEPVRSRPATVLLRRHFTEKQVRALRPAVTAAVATAGMATHLVYNFVLAVHELVTNAVRHGGGAGHLELRLTADMLTCEIVDHGGKAEHLPVRLPSPEQTGGRGLWMAHRLTGTLVLTQRPDGVTASVSACVVPAPPAAPMPRPASNAGAAASADSKEDR